MLCTRLTCFLTQWHMSTFIDLTEADAPIGDVSGGRHGPVGTTSAYAYDGLSSPSSDSSPLRAPAILAKARLGGSNRGGAGSGGGGVDSGGSIMGAIDDSLLLSSSPSSVSSPLRRRRPAVRPAAAVAARKRQRSPSPTSTPHLDPRDSVSSFTTTTSNTATSASPPVPPRARRPSSPGGPAPTTTLPLPPTTRRRVSAPQVAPAARTVRRSGSRPRTDQDRMNEWILHADVDFVNGANGRGLHAALLGGLSGKYKVLEDNMVFREMPVTGALTWTFNGAQDEEDGDDPRARVAAELADVVLIRLAGTTWLALVQNRSQLVEHVKFVKQNFPGKRVTYVLESYEEALRQQKRKAAAAHRRHVSAALAGEADDEGAHNRASVALALTQASEEHRIWLHVVHNCQVAVTRDSHHTAAFILRMTWGLCKRLQKQDASIRTSGNSATSFSFCLEAVPVVHSSSDAATVWRAQLEQIHGMSSNRARAVATVYPCLRSLLTAYRDPVLTDHSKKLLLAELSVISDDGLSTRSLGPVLSERVWKVFTCRDPEEVV